MSKSYWLAQIDVKNADEYKKYTAALGPVLKKHGARYVFRGGKVDLREGNMKPRIIIVEFPTATAAAECYSDPDYAAIIPLRTPHTEADLAILEGYDGPQP
jgi:hypothetical protein